MAGIKNMLFVITMILGIAGVIVMDQNAVNSAENNGNQTLATDGDAYLVDSGLEADEISAVPSAAPGFIESDIEADGVTQETPKPLIVIDENGDEIEVPEIVIADINDKEDPQPVIHVSTDNSAVAIGLPTIAPTEAPVDTSEGYVEHVTKIGIDVSKWQGNINWAKVKAAGVDFVMIRTGYRGSVYGKIVADPTFYSNIEGALANGIEVGVYFYSQAINEAEAKQEAAWVCELIKNYNITYPVAYDLEEIALRDTRVYGVSYAQLNKNAYAFLSYVESQGYRGSLYACKSYLESVWNLDVLGKFHIWLAHYTKNQAQTSYKGRYDMWQYSDRGVIDGIPEKVDLNYAYFTYVHDPEPTPTITEEVTPTPELTMEPEPTEIVEPEETPTPEITEPIEEVEEEVITEASGVKVVNFEEGLPVYDSYKEENILGTLSNGEEVDVVGYSSFGYVIISYGGGNGYVNPDFLGDVIIEEEIEPQNLE